MPSNPPEDDRATKTESNRTPSTGGTETALGPPDWVTSGKTGTHLLVVNWESESERVNMNKALRPYNDENLVKPPGTVRVLSEDVDVAGLMSSLVSEVPAERIYLAELEPQTDLTPFLRKEATLRYTFEEEPADIRSILNYLITNVGGKQKTPTGSNFVISRAGEVTVEVSYTVNEGKTVEIEFRGHAEEVARLQENFRESLAQIDGATFADRNDREGTELGVNENDI